MKTILRRTEHGARKFLAALCLLAGGWGTLAAQDTQQLGPVHVDAVKRSVSFPAVFNQEEGPLEYVLVGAAGKVHESLLRTEVEALQLHTAMLLLGAKTGEGRPGGAPPSEITADYLRTAPALKGEPVLIFLKWTVDGKETICRAEELIYNSETRADAASGEWTYNGSMFEGRRFLAQEEKSFVALVTDPAALINNPRPGHEDDQRWSVDKKKTPPKDTPVEVTIVLRSAFPTP